jgi:hypothetical protein
MAKKSDAASTKKAEAKAKKAEPVAKKVKAEAKPRSTAARWPVKALYGTRTSWSTRSPARSRPAVRTRALKDRLLKASNQQLLKLAAGRSESLR